MLDAFFQAGWVPLGVTSALVTPANKKGSDLDTGNHRPIAFGEPLYRFHTIIRNKYLTDLSEQHGFAVMHRQASVHSLLQPTICLPCGNFADHAHIWKAPLYACFIGNQKILCSGSA